MYNCQNCGKKIDDIEKFVTCPYCGHKIITKERPPLAKQVQAD
ncbi:DNA-directed RNA polymerase subunit P [archaeon]